MSDNELPAAIAVSSGHARTVENFPDEIAPAFAAANKLRAETIRPVDAAEEPTVVYALAHDGKAAS